MRSIALRVNSLRFLIAIVSSVETARAQPAIDEVLKMLRVDYSGVQWAEKDICSQKAVNYLIEQRSVLNAKGDTIGLNGFGAFAGERLARCALLQYEKDTKGTALANDAVRLSFAEWVS